MTWLRHIPNGLTGLNLAAGTGALMCALDGRQELILPALILVVVALVCDLADGRVARSFGFSSPMGMELDSLADLVSFGVAPALLVWKHRLVGASTLEALAVLAFVVCGALRLARFNVLSQQGSSSKDWFVGLPIPGAAALVLSLGLGHAVPGFGTATGRSVVVAALWIGAFLMVSTVRFPSPKQLPLSSGPFVIAAGVAVFAGAWVLEGRLALVAVAYVLGGLALASSRGLRRLERRSAGAGLKRRSSACH